MAILGLALYSSLVDTNLYPFYLLLYDHSLFFFSGALGAAPAQGGCQLPASGVDRGVDQAQLRYLSQLFYGTPAVAGLGATGGFRCRAY